MLDSQYAIIAARLGLKNSQVVKVAELFAQGATIPFIARYRKEASGGLDEIALAALRDNFELFDKLNKRRDSIIANLAERGLLVPELEQRLADAETLETLEDIYLPFKQKRKTRASIAREKGLEQLALDILEQQSRQIDVSPYISAESGVATAVDALQGASDIIAEIISENTAVRAELRKYFAAYSVLSSKTARGKDVMDGVFRDYSDYSEPIGRVPSHRALAVMRGQDQGLLSIQSRPDSERALVIIRRHIVRNPRSAFHDILENALVDSYDRLLMPSLENETLKTLKSRADAEAIKVFADNLRQLLLEAPLGRVPVIAVDPGFRTGCKTAVIDTTGQLCEHFVIFPFEKPEEALRLLNRAVEKFYPRAVAVGNGTAGRETEAFLKSGLTLPVISVNESGASIYSASELAREEFPDLDLTFRSAVSIGRRLQDPLAELIKIDPKSIGVGQYQHDVDQNALKQALDDVVINCVNNVGVELNSASAVLLSYVAGLGPALARNIIAYRSAHGAFTSRSQLLKVDKLGPKAFEQAAGFLRVSDSANHLDASAVHPERYALVQRIAKDRGLDVAGLMRELAGGLEIPLKDYVDSNTGLPTLNDIIAELRKPGRDPRPEFEFFSFDDNVRDISDLSCGMRLPGIVTNITKFGAFVDVGVHHDGLIHISKIAKRFISDPGDVLKLHDRVTVTVIDVDKDRKRISLSLID